jgi:hypothetical protein
MSGNPLVSLIYNKRLVSSTVGFSTTIRRAPLSRLGEQLGLFIEHVLGVEDGIRFLQMHNLQGWERREHGLSTTITQSLERGGGMAERDLVDNGDVARQW